MPPEVTAVITTHGRPARVPEALASVRAESHRDIELVVADDGGEFEPPAESSELPLRIVRGVGLGVARARNLGLSAARGEFVIFLDDDDIALPDRISRLLGAARSHQATVCFGLTRRLVDSTAELLPSVPTNHSSTRAVRFCELLTCNPHINAVLVRTEALRAVGGFDTGAHHFDDWSAWLRIADRNAVVWSVDETVAEWRIHTDGLSADIMRNGAMKTRLLALFDRLEPSLSEANARSVAEAREILAATEIVTYDDYVAVMAAERERRQCVKIVNPQ